MCSLSVCIPCYNYGQYLRAAVEPLLRAEVPDLEILIIDDCSGDETPVVAAELARQDPRVAYHRNERRLGHIRTYNKGIDWARKEHFLLLSADDIVLSREIQPRLEFLYAHPEVVFGYAPIYCFYMDGSPANLLVPPGHEDVREPRITTGDTFIRRSLETRLCLPPYLTTIVRTSAIQAAGGYRPEHPIAGDLELWLRVACLGAVAYHPAPAGLYRRHGKNMSGPARHTERIAAHAAFESAMESVGRRYPALLSLWRGSQQAWARDMFIAAGSALEDGRPDEAARAVMQARAIDRTLASNIWRLRLLARRLAGERLWRALRAVAKRVRVPGSSGHGRLPVRPHLG